MKEQQKTNHRAAQMIIGKLSGKRITIPDANVPPMPALVPPGVVHNGKKAENFGEIDSSRGYPDVRSFRRKFGLIIPATNTSMEHELWSIIFKNQGPDGLRGVGLHTANVITPKPKLETEDDLLEYKRQFLGGLRSAVDVALLAEPQYMIMGMSLEHILRGIEEIRAPMVDIEAYSGLSWATWHDAFKRLWGNTERRESGS
jgi:maleate isomerase